MIDMFWKDCCGGRGENVRKMSFAELSDMFRSLFYSTRVYNVETQDYGVHIDFYLYDDHHEDFVEVVGKYVKCRVIGDYSDEDAKGITGVLSKNSLVIIGTTFVIWINWFGNATIRIKEATGYTVGNFPRIIMGDKIIKIRECEE